MFGSAPLQGHVRLVLLLLLVGGSSLAAEAPRLELDGEQLVLTGLPPILTEDGVKEHLTTGLTTSIYFQPGGQQIGGARVDVRYDPWDEVFYVAAWGHGERIQRAEAPSFASLVEWWQELRLVLLEIDRLEMPWPRRLKITADVLPFSAAEQDDARRWFSERIEKGRRSGTDEVGRSGDESAETLSRTFDLLLATSIRRRAMASFRWTLNLPPGPREQQP